jgi:hypothetical protein
MPRGRKPNPKPVPVEAAPQEKRKRGRPKKVVPQVVVEASKPVDVLPIIKKPVEVAPKREPAPVDPEQQKLIDKHNADFKKRIDKAMEDATPDNAISKLFEALGGSSVNW